MPTPPEILVCADSDALAARATELFITAARDAIAEKGRFTVALSGGSTPEKLYALLATPENAARVQWDSVYVFMGDERFVPSTDENSNFGKAQASLLSHVPIPASNLFPMPTPPVVTDLADGARRYVSTLSTFWELPDLTNPPVLDFVIMGLGEDGHTASLFPGNPSLDTVRNWVVGSPPGTLPPPVDRLTLTLPVFNAARQTVFLVSGAKKAEAVQDVLENHPTPSVRPAAGVQPTDGKLIWLLDEEAASKLSTETAPDAETHS